MKLRFRILAIVLILNGSRLAFAQGFVNLNFEAATIVQDPASPYYPYGVYASSAIPGWTAYISGTPQGTILYNNETLGEAAISLQGNGIYQPIQGNYFVLLQATFLAPHTNTAAVGQTGQIPTTAKSLVFWGSTSLSGLSSDMEITFNGVAIPYTAVGSGTGYTAYGADISSLSGQTGQLLFTAFNNTYASLDNIQFSAQAIPEPCTLGFLTFGCMFLGLHRREPSR